MTDSVGTCAHSQAQTSLDLFSLILGRILVAVFQVKLEFVSRAVTSYVVVPTPIFFLAMEHWKECCCENECL